MSTLKNDSDLSPYVGIALCIAVPLLIAVIINTTFSEQTEDISNISELSDKEIKRILLETEFCETQAVQEKYRHLCT